MVPLRKMLKFKIPFLQLSMGSKLRLVEGKFCCVIMIEIYRAGNLFQLYRRDDSPDQTINSNRFMISLLKIVGST